MIDFLVDIWELIKENWVWIIINIIGFLVILTIVLIIGDWIGFNVKEIIFILFF